MDLIDRRDVLDLPRNITKNFYGEVVEETVNVEDIKALPSKQPDLSSYNDKLWRAEYERGKAEAQQWIPCSERLPEKEAYYLITYGGAVTWQHWLHNRWYGIGDPERVTAWMPLPEPYKGGEQDE